MSTHDQKGALMTAYRKLDDLQCTLAEILMDACDELEADPDFEPEHDCAVFEEADPELDDIRYAVYELQERVFDLLRENHGLKTAREI